MPKLNESAARLLKTAIESGITSPNELANLMGNASVETDAFTRMTERLVYTSVGKITSTVSSSLVRFTREEIQSAIDSRDPRRIATILYEGRNENDLGNSESGDGWRFRGRGYFQLTGRGNYRTYGEAIGVDLEANPDAATDHEVAARIALEYWKRMPRAIRQDARHAGRSINGGKTGEDERHKAATLWATVITPGLVRDVQAGLLDLDELTQFETDVRVVGVVRSNEVRQLQRDLDELGYTDARDRKLKVDGDSGTNTRAAVEKFQRDHELTVNGHASPSVVAAVRDAVVTKHRAFGQPEAPYLRQDEPNEAMTAYRSFAREPVHGLISVDHTSIRALQQHLNILGITDLNGHPLETHGVYDMSTQTAVAVFQRSQGLNVTGQPDEQTRSILHGQAFIAELKQLPQAPVVEPTPWADPAPRAQRQPSLAPPELEPMRFSDPKHPQNALYGELKRMLPEKTKEDRVAQITAACYEGGIKPGRIGTFEIKDDRIEVFGALTGYADVDLLQRPAEQESLERVQSFDRQQMQELAQLQAQRQEASLGPAMVR